MTKREFIKSLMDDTGLFKNDATKIVNVVFDHIRKRILQGCDVRIDGVGRFGLRYKEAGTVNNNLVGERHKVGPRVKLRFTVFPSMQRDMNRSLLEEQL